MLADPNATTVALTGGLGPGRRRRRRGRGARARRPRRCARGQDVPGVGGRGTARRSRPARSPRRRAAIVPIPSRAGTARSSRSRSRRPAALSAPDAGAGRRLRARQRSSTGAAVSRHEVVPIHARTLVRVTRPSRPRFASSSGSPTSGPGRRTSSRAAVEGTRHARADADGLGQVPHLPARRDAAPRADARPLAADRADEGPGRPAAARDRRHRDVRQLVARAGGRRPRDPRTSRRARRGSSTPRPSGCAMPRSSRRCARSASASS